MVNPKDEKNITREELTELMKKVTEMKEKLRLKTIEAAKWHERVIAIDRANSEVFIELENNQKENRYYTNLIENKSKALKAGQQKINWYKDRNQNEIRDYWKYCEEMLEKYRNLFIDAFIEYRSENLTNDIEKNLKKAQEVAQQIIIIDNDMEHLTKSFGLIELRTNQQANIYHQDLKSAIATLSNEEIPLLLTTRSAENTITGLKRKIKGKEQEIMNLINKRKLN